MLSLSLPTVLLFVGCAIGALGVVLAMPKRDVAPFILGAIVGAAGFALAVFALGMMAVKAGGGIEGVDGESGLWRLPNYHFYIFSIVALGSALRVVTHQRPIYSALYFILTIVSSAGLYILLSAEFLAFALIIIYAGAILITYMFVIMLATEGPSEEAVEASTEYDRVAREPVIAVAACFVIVAALTAMVVGGAPGLKVNQSRVQTGQQLAMMPERVETVLKNAGMLREGETVARKDVGGKSLVEIDTTPQTGKVVVESTLGGKRDIPITQWPPELKLSNTEGVAFELIDGNPGAIEVAGIILLMAMLGAVVLARKKVEMDEATKKLAAERARTDDELGAEGPFVQPSTGGQQS
jgi:NADH-quinone oxidoreductase subunit J